MKWFPEKSKSKNTKKFTRVRRMWGCLTLFVPSPFSTSLDFLKFFGPSYGLNVVSISPLHLEGGQMIFGKIEIEKDYKIHKGTKNVRNPWDFFSIFWFRFFRISFDHLLSVTNLFKQHSSHMMPTKILKSPKKWRFVWVRRMWGFLTFFVPFLIF